ncbi:MAG: hypothetical protein PVI33_05155 [Candidatus Omnitrophota bacterium]|jgi:hypothetical protein
MRRIFIIGLLLGYCLVVLAGCASLKQGIRGFLGISTKEIENARVQAIVKIVDYDYASCYKMVEARLAEIKSYIYTRRADLIAVYISQTDTTPAGVFFREVDNQKTEIAIASPASDTKEYLADKIFSLFLKER